MPSYYIQLIDVHIIIKLKKCQGHVHLGAKTKRKILEG